MKPRSFLNHSEHTENMQMIDTVIDHSAELSNGKQEIASLIDELVKEKQTLQGIFSQYRDQFENLRFFISDYKLRQIQIRKKIRELQIKVKKKK